MSTTEVLAWSIIEENARAFSARWVGVTREMSESQTFWGEFLAVFGVNRRHAGVVFEAPVKIAGRAARIDVLYPGKFLAEHKSTGKNLDAAMVQAMQYVAALPVHDRPSVVAVCDFDTFVVLVDGERHEFNLAKLDQHVQLFGVVAGRDSANIASEESVDKRTARLMADVHAALLVNGYNDEAQLAILLTRLAYCMFAEDAGVFSYRSFTDMVENRTAADGSDLGPLLGRLFTVLDTPVADRQKNLPSYLAEFPYVNGGLFAKVLDLPEFDDVLRDKILATAIADWRGISPIVFGSLFQDVMEAHGPTGRRELGAHYTSENNIRRVLDPLFLTELWEQAENVPVFQLSALHDQLSAITVLDPACGCGNFLAVAYREMRRVEHLILQRMGKSVADIKVNPRNFLGIEISEFPSRVAEASLWMVDQLMNLEATAQFGVTVPFLPLPKERSVQHANALTVNWPQADFIIGNPPFRGFGMQSTDQKFAMQKIIGGTTKLDFVASWFVKAANYIQADNNVRASFVTTNSIAQGVQKPELINLITDRGLGISYTPDFKWTNGASGGAAVHCVIGTMSKNEITAATVQKQDKPLSDVLRTYNGSQPTDGKNLIITAEQRKELIRKYPQCAPWIRSYLGSDELINGRVRYVIWLKGVSITDLRAATDIMHRIEAVRTFRLLSKKADTRKAAATPSLFHGDRQPIQNYLAIPQVSSNNRTYIPIAMVKQDVIASNKLHTISGAELWHFAMLTSLAHMSWMRENTGRMKSDYQYSPVTVYNTFVWPILNAVIKDKLTVLGQAILDARATHPDCTLADLYDPLTMPANLRKAHDANDKYVDSLYGLTNATEETRLAELMRRYQKAVS